MNFINDISAYPKSIIEIDSTNFHLNYSDNFITRIEIPELDEIIENNFNATISKALIHFEIDSSNSNYFVPEAGIKISFSKFNDYDLVIKVKDFSINKNSKFYYDSDNHYHIKSFFAN